MSLNATGQEVIVGSYDCDLEMWMEWGLPGTTHFISWVRSQEYLGRKMHAVTVSEAVVLISDQKELIQ